MGLHLPTIWEVWHYSKGREKLLWHDRMKGNILTDEGEQWFLYNGLYQFNTVAAAWQCPASLYLGLATDAGFTETTTLTTLSSELAVANNYSRQAIAASVSGWTISKSGTSYQALSTTETFNATPAGWSEAFSLFMTDAASGTSGKLIAIKLLTTSVTVGAGEDLDVTVTISLGEG
jgi:hypothetical protein